MSEFRANADIVDSLLSRDELTGSERSILRQYLSSSESGRGNNEYAKEGTRQRIDKIRSVLGLQLLSRVTESEFENEKDKAMDALHQKLLQEFKNALKAVPIREENLRSLREQYYARPEFRGRGGLAELNAAVATASKGSDNAAVEEAVQALIRRTEEVVMLFLSEAEAECALPEIDLPKTRVLMQLAYSNAKQLSAGRHNNPTAMNALKEGQAAFAVKNPEAVKKLVGTYIRTIMDEMGNEKPDHIMLRQWIDLCTGFAPDIAPQLEKILVLAIQKRLEFFMAKVEAELSKEKPDLGVIQMNITVPPNYYNQLPNGSTIPERMKTLEARVAALQKK